MTNVRRKNVALGSLLVAACWGGLKGCDAFRAVGSPPLLLLRTGVTLLDGTASGIPLAFGGKSSITLHSSVSDSNNEVVEKLSEGLRELSECVSITYGYLFKPDDSVTAEDVVMSCDAVDEEQPNSLRQKAHEFGRYHLLVKLLKTDYDAYVKTAEFLSPSRIARLDLPNLQDVAYDPASEDQASTQPSSRTVEEDGKSLVADCELEDMKFSESPLDKILLSIFRSQVTENTGGVTSDIPGIKGLLAQGREYMTKELPEGVTYAEHSKEQNTMVKKTLAALMTPVLPPFYRIFMSGIVPKLGTEWDGKQIGPWFYAPWLTTIVTPIFFGFLVGPSRPNRRSDGQRGGLVVEKCKFLQESGCKGLCLHQCKIPAQDFFREELGLDLTVKPNFVTQECQWSFGEKPLTPDEDPSFPNGCLVGCESRKAMADRKGEVLCM